MRLEKIDLDSIKMENPYLRLGTDVASLEESIKNLGLLAPLVINNRNILLAGARRWQALKNLGYEEVEVLRVDMDNLREELLSIDENLVRKDLNTTEMEQHLRRAKEIYKELIVNEEGFRESLIEKRKENSDDESAIPRSGDFDSNTLAIDEFSEQVSQKSGLGKKQIIKAIERAEKSSVALKEAREKGEVNVSQANEMIRLSHEEQEELVPHIKDRTVKELKKIVKDVRSLGVEAALLNNTKTPHAKEMVELSRLLKRVNKITESLKAEGLKLGGPTKSEIIRYWENSVMNMDEILESQSQVFTPDYLNEQSRPTQ